MIKSIFWRILGIPVIGFGIFLPCASAVVMTAAWCPIYILRALKSWWVEKVCTIASWAKGVVDLQVRIGLIMVLQGVDYKTAKAELVDAETNDEAAD